MKKTLIVFGLMMALSQSAFAYVGPGVGLGALGVLVGIIGTVVMAIVGVVWYPLKRVLKRKSGTAEEKEADAKEEAPEAFDDSAAEKAEENAVN